MSCISHRALQKPPMVNIQNETDIAGSVPTGWVGSQDGKPGLQTWALKALKDLKALNALKALKALNALQELGAWVLRPENEVQCHLPDAEYESYQ